MEKKDLVWVILISVIALILVSLTIPVLIKTSSPMPAQQTPPQDQLQWSPGQPVQPVQPAGSDESHHLKSAISFINIGLIIPLFVVYAGIYRQMRSSFTLGLMVVIFALGMYAITSCPLIISLAGGKTGEIGLFQILPDLCTTIALVILIRISLE